MLSGLASHAPAREAGDDYTSVHTRGRVYPAYLALKDFERMLDASKYLRIHQSHVVNMDHVAQSQLAIFRSVTAVSRREKAAGASYMSMACRRSTKSSSPTITSAGRSSRASWVAGRPFSADAAAALAITVLK